MAFAWEDLGLKEEIVPEHSCKIVPCTVVSQKHNPNVGFVAGFLSTQFCKIKKRKFYYSRKFIGGN